jgi:hypothetical protein
VTPPALPLATRAVRKKRSNAMGARHDYFAVNDKAAGLRTSFRVSGRLGECGKRWCLFHDASADAKRLNRAYELGFAAGFVHPDGKRR